MNTKILLSALVTGIFYFLAGWVVYGMLLMNFMTSEMTSYPGLMKTEAEMNFALIIVSNLAFGLVAAMIADKTNSHSFKSGALTMLWVGFLISLSFDTQFLAMYNLYSTKFAVVDIVVGSLFASMGGGISGYMLGRGK